MPLLARKRRLAKLLGRSQRWAIRFVEHLTGDGPTIFHHVCRVGAGGHRLEADGRAVSQRAVKERTWVNSKNPESAAVQRKREEEWR